MPFQDPLAKSAIFASFFLSFMSASQLEMQVCCLFCSWSGSTIKILPVWWRFHYLEVLTFDIAMKIPQAPRVVVGSCIAFWILTIHESHSHWWSSQGHKFYFAHPTALVFSLQKVRKASGSLNLTSLECNMYGVESWSWYVCLLAYSLSTVDDTSSSLASLFLFDHSCWYVESEFTPWKMWNVWGWQFSFEADEAGGSSVGCCVHKKSEHILNPNTVV